jgi:hypothetical protein
LNVSVSSVIVRNQTPAPGVSPLSTFPQSSAAVQIPVSGGVGDHYEVRIVDVDGNEYLDFTLSQGPLILGHSHPQVLAEEMVTTIDHPVVGRYRTMTKPIKFSDTPGPAPTASPTFGQHSDEVLAGHGYRRAVYPPRGILQEL